MPSAKMKRSSAILAALVDGGEQVAHRGLAVAFDVLRSFSVVRVVALGQGENVGGLHLTPARRREKALDLLLAEALDVEGVAARRNA